MASAISHPAVALALAPWFRRAGIGRRALAFGVLCCVLPDVDAVGFWLGVPYGSVLGHRGLTHSLLFATALAGAVAALAFRNSPSRGTIFGFLFLCAASHGLLDPMTDGGRGVAFFAPFDDRRYFLPRRPVRVSPIGVEGLLGRRGLAIAASELLWIWLPSLLVGAIGWMTRNRGSVREPSAGGR